MQKSNNTSLSFHFFYGLLWFGFGVLWIIIRFPYRVQLSIGKGLGHVLFYCNKRLRHIAEINLNLCFPDCSEEERLKLLKKNFASIGIGIIETGLAWWGRPKQLRSLIHYHGLEHLEKAMNDKRGFLILGAHFTTLELVGKLVALDYDVVIVYRAHKKPWVNKIITKILKKNYIHIIERNNVRALIRALKQGKVIWYPPDIDAGYYDHVFVPFFGVPAASLTATARLAEFTHAGILPVAFYRKQDGLGYDICFSSPLQDFPGENTKEDTARINQIIEAAIRKQPDQYLWQYKRFKTRPNNEARFY